MFRLIEQGFGGFEQQNWTDRVDIQVLPHPVYVDLVGWSHTLLWHDACICENVVEVSDTIFLCSSQQYPMNDRIYRPTS